MNINYCIMINGYCNYIVQLMHTIIIILYIFNKGLPDECGKKANVAVTGLLLLPVSKEDSKTFCPMSRIRPVTTSPASNGKYPVNTSHRSRLV